MRILIYTPLNETVEYTTLPLYNMLKDQNCFSIPDYKNYLKVTGLAKNEEEAILKSLITAKEFVKKKHDYILIGTCDKSIKFDLIFGYNTNHEESIAQEDKQIKIMKNKYINSYKIYNLIKNLYDNEDCESFLGGTKEQIYKFIERNINGV